MLREDFTSPGWAAGTDGVAKGGSDIILLVCRIGLASLFYFSIQGKLANMEGFVASLASRGVPGGMALGYLAVTAEIVGSLGVLLGLGTRYAALLLVLFVIVATAISHLYWLRLSSRCVPRRRNSTRTSVSLRAICCCLSLGPVASRLTTFLDESAPRRR